jgi:predicted ATPase
MVLVAGEPGIGKTRLVEAVAAGATGSTVACARCFAAGDAPAFWPWAQVLRSLAETVDLRAVHDTRTADAANLVPALADRSPEVAPALPPDAARFQRYDAITTLLCRAAAERPITIVLDDLQWADAASLRLLPVLARILPRRTSWCSPPSAPTSWRHRSCGRSSPISSGSAPSSGWSCGGCHRRR